MYNVSMKCMLVHKYTDMRQTTSILLRNAARRDLGKEIKILSNDGGWEPCFTLPQERYCSLTY